MNTLSNKKNGGFTMVEAMIAIGVLVSAIIGATSAVQTGLSSYIISKDQVIAFYLAQEGFEGIRNLRDENALSGDPDRHWLAGISANPSDPCYFGKTCMINVLAPGPGIILTECPGGICGPLLQDSEGLYGYGLGWTETKFRRQVVLSPVGTSTTEIAVEVTIDWSKGPIPLQFKARENLLDWY